MAKYKGKMSDIEEIRKLEPEERIRRLKEVEEGRKKEIEEAETLIRDSMLELEDTAEKKVRSHKAGQGARHIPASYRGREAHVQDSKVCRRF